MNFYVKNDKLLLSMLESAYGDPICSGGGGGGVRDGLKEIFTIHLL